MNTPNPLIPQGTFPNNRGRSHIRIAVFTILAVHVVLLGALLMAGCKKNIDSANEGSNATNYPDIGFRPPVNPAAPDTNIASGPIPPVNPLGNIPGSPLTNSDLTSSITGAEHVVVKGDSFYTIGKKYGVGTKAVADANPGVDSTKLKIGQKLKIPTGAAVPTAGTPHSTVNGNGASTTSEKTYIVKSGDNLMKIAKSNGTTVKALRSANALKTDQIKVGQKLKIPSKVSAPIPEPLSTSAVPVTTP